VSKLKSGGSRKFGRNLIKCSIYKSRGVRLRNKIRKLKKYLKKHPTDRQAQNRLKELV